MENPIPNKEINFRRYNSSVKMDSIPELKTDIVNLRREIKKNKEAIEDKENVIKLLRENSDTEKEKQITGIQNQIAGIQNEIAEIQKQIAAKENQIAEILKQITAKENQITAQSTYCMHYLTFFFCFTDTSFSPIPIRLLLTVCIFILA